MNYNPLYRFVSEEEKEDIHNSVTAILKGKHPNYPWYDIWILMIAIIYVIMCVIIVKCSP